MRLIQAFMDEPRYLILDEPFDALDENTKQSVKAFIDHCLSQDEKRMLIYTSHSEKDDEFANQILYIKDHKLQLK